MDKNASGTADVSDRYLERISHRHHVRRNGLRSA
jgi:hypothetical protein